MPFIERQPHSQSLLVVFLIPALSLQRGLWEAAVLLMGKLRCRV